MLKIILTLSLSILPLSSCVVNKNSVSLNDIEFIVTHILNESDGQTITLRDNNKNEYKTVISIANGNWIFLDIGDIITLEIEDIIDFKPQQIISKNIKIIRKENTDEYIECTISTEKHSYNPGEPIELEMKVKNFGNEPFTFLPWKTPVENCFTGEFLTVVFEKDTLDYQGILVKRLPPITEDYITVMPNKSIQGKVNLLDGYQLTKKGFYTIQFNNNSTENLPKSNKLIIQIK